MKENPIHIPKWLIHLFNLITLENHKHKLNIDLGIQMQRLSSATLENWSAGMKFGNHNNKDKLQGFMERQLKISGWTKLLQLPHEFHKR